MIDVHAHILPHMDDGSRSTSESLAMLEESTKQGINLVAATPHFYARENSPEEFLKRRGRSAARLRERWCPGLPELRLGAEVFWFEGMSRWEGLESLCMESKNQPIRILQVLKGGPVCGGIENFVMNYYRHIDRKRVQFDFLVHSKKKGYYDDEIKALGGEIYYLSLLDDRNVVRYIGDLFHFFTEHKEGNRSIDTFWVVEVLLRERNDLNMIIGSYEYNFLLFQLGPMNSSRLASYDEEIQRAVFTLSSALLQKHQPAKKKLNEQQCRIEQIFLTRDFQGWRDCFR